MRNHSHHRHKQAAQALGPIAQALKDTMSRPPFADIHFLPSAAMEAAKHDKVRINPGNYADNKKFAVKEYTDSDYAEELERLHEAFTPIVLRCKELGRAMRIGTNHGSLSDRIMNRYGDTPLGMVESALEFIRIAESHNYHDICLSLKASNPKVMIEAYRLAVSKMQTHGMNYPLHLGVTEAGDGEDARIKSAIGIGTLLNDGIGDTIRVSLTEDPVHEIPVAQSLAQKAMQLWAHNSPKADSESDQGTDQIDPSSFTRNPTQVIELNTLAPSERPTHHALSSRHTTPRRLRHLIQTICKHQIQAKENKLEGLLLDIHTPPTSNTLQNSTKPPKRHPILRSRSLIQNRPRTSENAQLSTAPKSLIFTQKLDKTDAHYATQLLQYCRDQQSIFALNAHPQDIEDAISHSFKNGTRKSHPHHRSRRIRTAHPLSRTIPSLLETAKTHFPNAPIWIRNTHANSIAPETISLIGSSKAVSSQATSFVTASATSSRLKTSPT